MREQHVYHTACENVEPLPEESNAFRLDEYKKHVMKKYVETAG